MEEFAREEKNWLIEQGYEPTEILAKRLNLTTRQVFKLILSDNFQPEGSNFQIMIDDPEDNCERLCFSPEIENRIETLRKQQELQGLYTRKRICQALQIKLEIKRILV